jgi:formylglycine-generating enzyme required for sulfatase activity
MPRPCFAISLLVLALTLSAARAAEPTLSIDLGDGVRLELVLVKKGTFEQGSPPDEPGRSDDEKQRRVTLTRDFYLGKYPVTRGQFARFVRETGYRTEAERGASGGFGWDGKELVQRKGFTWRNPGFEQKDDHPVVLVTYDDARRFLAWLSRNARRRCDLPSEAEWEYACRAGTTTPYYNGRTEQEAREIAWFKADAGDGTRAVGKKKPNAWGLHDMSGNAWEWCRDWYGPYEAGPVTDPERTEPVKSEPARRVLRGGSWLREAKHCRSAARYRNTPGSRNADNGFRVLAAVEEPPNEGAVPQVPASPPAGGGDEPKAGPMPSPFPLPPPVSHTGPTPPGGGWPGFFGPVATCFGLACVGGIILAALLARQMSRTRTLTDQARPSTSWQPPHPGSVGTRAAADGFWLDTSGLVAGSVVRYRCRVNGEERTGEVHVTPGPEGQFIYTGGTPSDIEVPEVIPPQPPPGPGTFRRSYWPRFSSWPSRPPRTPPTHPSRPTPPPQPFTGYPSAY